MIPAKTSVSFRRRVFSIGFGTAHLSAHEGLETYILQSEFSEHSIEANRGIKGARTLAKKSRPVCTDTYCVVTTCPIVYSAVALLRDAYPGIFNRVQETI